MDITNMMKQDITQRVYDAIEKAKQLQPQLVELCQHAADISMQRCLVKPFCYISASIRQGSFCFQHLRFKWNI